ncbi:hypothetical protein KSP40_PGU003185 [Platanthera guangdongensis]|uniref:XS domain-containing protein n=1 Tax=Platanthera guangdongensis TaxID=2320717 RepID=A0ABR2LNG3_9ASPA
MNLTTVGNEFNTSADAGGRQSVKRESYEEPTGQEGNVVRLIHEIENVEIKSNQDGERGLTGDHSISQPGVTDTGRTSHDNWSQFINLEETFVGGNFEPQKSNSSRGSWEPSCNVPSSTLPPPLQNGWLRPERACRQTDVQVKISNVHPHDESIAVYDSEFDKLSQDRDASGHNDENRLLDDCNVDLGDEFDSDDSQKSHEKRKKNKWLRPFFESLDKLSSEQITEQVRQWHCPACQDGPGAINWFIGLHTLMAHAKTKGTIRLRLHREFAELLVEELRRRGTPSFIPSGESFGKWKGLCETSADHEIVWPPMVIVLNTMLEKDEDDKWKGMGNQELLEYFNTYEVVKARHSYGPNGHRGMSVLIFEASAMGYFEAERLHKQFSDEGRDRDSWERHPVLFSPGGQRQLYGFLASKDDVIMFNKHSHGKTALKFERRSYQEMVVSPMKQIREHNQELIWLKNKVREHEQRSKVLEEAYENVRQKLRDTIEENQILRLRTKIQQEENKEEMGHQEKFFKNQMDKIHNVTKEKEGAFEKLLQVGQRKDNLCDETSGTIIDGSWRECLWMKVSALLVKQRKSLSRKEEIGSLVTTQAKCVEEFEAATDKRMLLREENKTELSESI